MENYERETLKLTDDNNSAENKNPNAIPPNLQTFANSLAALDDGVNEFRKRMNQLSVTKQNLDSFNESFASFLYGLQINAFCVDYENAPLAESASLQKIKDQLKMEITSRQRQLSAPSSAGIGSGYSHEFNASTLDETFTTNDTSFIERPESFPVPR
ncbi:DASH complex subunit Dam1 [Schizosaccharomyces cryophilus OY26]|uniref:DASH complex subunit DAM1 n=1 Tax=Schizosaccharomyces cryophilus (strain OY26 / ATCC MYA-4695 / CBS 11777 / NBRC 106824 / NRRL Y48691) TaxID=653667 RepID=S9W4D3_SCHCR|nr:DASH complex subunit Dam1 [Schizosaccharomyces cryophilus OY26]EPY53359.1 DASH complex subunit Dam1 [Schizosaccharomyces cryophilus OY26]